jgi:hypothetical protein
MGIGVSLGLMCAFWTSQVLAGTKAKAAPPKVIASYSCEDAQYSVGIQVFNDEISTVHWKVVSKATQASAKYTAIILGSSAQAFGASSIGSDIDFDGVNNTAILTIAGVDSNLTCQSQK